MRKMRGFERLIKLSDAQKIIMEKCGDFFGVENVSSDQGSGRVLAEDVKAITEVPPFDRSAVDGYAIRSGESFSASSTNPAVFILKGSAEAGSAKGRIEAGECYEIFTGAEIPEGADAVVMAEDCSIEGMKIIVKRAVPKGANISFRGEDIKEGEVMVRKGETLRPWHIAALIASNVKSVEVRRLPSVGVISTGSELDADRNERMKAGRIADSTRPMIIGMLKELGCAVVDAGIVGDDLCLISDKIGSLVKQADMVITIGGTSLGARDLVPEAFEAATGKGLIFHGVSIKPGKPAGFGMAGRVPLFTLPGYPVSALVGFEVLVQPLLLRWLGRERFERRTIRASLSRRVPITPGVTHFLRVTIEEGDGGYIAHPIAITGSGLISSITKADGIAIINDDLEGIDEGEEIEVQLLRRIN